MNCLWVFIWIFWCSQTSGARRLRVLKDFGYTQTPGARTDAITHAHARTHACTRTHTQVIFIVYLALRSSKIHWPVPPFWGSERSQTLTTVWKILLDGAIAPPKKIFCIRQCSTRSAILNIYD